MDVLNFISWLRGSKLTNFLPTKTLIPVGIANPNRGDAYSPAVITSDNLIAQIATSLPIGPQGPMGPQGVAGPVGPAGLNWQGAWSNATVYAPDDAVGFGGASYFCLNAVGPSLSNPVVDTVNWALLASQGSPGPQGPQGIQGSGLGAYVDNSSWSMPIGFPFVGGYVSVPVNTYNGSDGILKAVATVCKTATTGTFSVEFWISSVLPTVGSSPSIGSVFLGGATTATTGQRTQVIERTFPIPNFASLYRLNSATLTTSNSDSAALAGATGSANAIFNNPYISTSVNWGVTQYVMMVITMVGASDPIAARCLTLNK
jgi:hypothetical protein